MNTILKSIVFITRELSVIRRILRRRYYILFRPAYVDKQLKNRKGICGQHGCCDLTIFSKVYNKQIRKCLDSKSRTTCRRWQNLPKECRLYPLDENDKIPETKNYCNFYWDEDIS